MYKTNYKLAIVIIKQISVFFLEMNTNDNSINLRNQISEMLTNKHKVGENVER